MDEEMNEKKNKNMNNLFNALSHLAKVLYSQEGDWTDIQLRRMEGKDALVTLVTERGYNYRLIRTMSRDPDDLPDPDPAVM